MDQARRSGGSSPRRKMRFQEQTLGMNPKPAPYRPYRDESSPLGVIREQRPLRLLAQVRAKTLGAIAPRTEDLLAELRPFSKVKGDIC
jgi:hypothetical protein